MDVNQFRQAVRNLATLAEDLWIQTEFYKGLILETNNVDPENLEALAQAALRVKDVRESAHNLFSPIHNVLDSVDTNDLIAELLEKHTPPGKPN